jgi:uncharacterized protein YjbJ (UPF0337 family)
MTSSSISKIIEGDWDQIKGKVKKNWGKLSNDDLSVIEGSYDTLVGKVKEVYGYTAKEAETQITHFVDQLADLKSGSKEVSEEGKGLAHEAVESLTESVQKCQERLSEIEDVVFTFMQKNPLKTTGIAMLTGLVIGKLLTSKK